MFNFSAFVLSTIERMIAAGLPDWQCMQYATTYYLRGVLTDEQMQRIEGSIAANVEVQDNYVDIESNAEQQTDESQTEELGENIA